MIKRSLVLLMMSLPLWASDAASLLQQKLDALRSYEADFSQVVRAHGRVVSQAKGHMFLLRPGRFVWDTKEPMAQQIVADGKTIWIYDKDLEQVTVKPQAKNIGGTAGLFLSGSNTQMARDFAILQDKTNTNLFRLKAKNPDENFQSLALRFDNSALQSMEMLDQLGQTTLIVFAKSKTNQTISPTRFQFAIPKGVDVVRE